MSLSTTDLAKFGGVPVNRISELARDAVPEIRSSLVPHSCSQYQCALGLE